MDSDRVQRNGDREYEVLLGKQKVKHTFDRIVVRLGAEPALDESFPEIARACRSRTFFGDDPTRWALYPTDFFPDSPGWRWPEGKDLRVSRKPRAESPHPLDNLDFVKLAKLCRTVDEQMMRSIRGRHQSFFSKRELADEHRTLVDARLRANHEGLGLEEFFERLHDEQYLRLLDRSVPRPDLVIEVGRGMREGRFDTLRFRRDGEVLQELKNRPLLWDCVCGKRSGIPNAACAVHSGRSAIELTRLFSDSLVSIEWRDLKFLWRNGSESWPPSIDSFLFVDTLEKIGWFRQSSSAMLDVGSGTGFLGIVAAKFNPSVQKVVLWDWLLTPILYGQINWWRNRGRRKSVNFHSCLGLYSQYLFPEVIEKSFDAVLCNPPYLPIGSRFRKFSLEETTCGTDLLEHVISRQPPLGKQVLIQFSKLAALEAAKAARLEGMKLVPVGTSHQVPFRIPKVFENRAYIASLRKREDGLQQRDGREWHSLQMYSVE